MQLNAALDSQSPLRVVPDTDTVQVAVIGSGLAGAACAAGLQRVGAKVTVFEKAQAVGCLTVTRHAGWIDANGVEQSVAFEDSAQYFTPFKRRFTPAVARALAAGCVSAWRPRVHAGWPFEAGQCLAAVPTMPSLCAHLLAGAVVHCNRTVQRLQRTADGRWFVATDGAPLSGPFNHVVVALPPAQAAVLLAGHQDRWADALMAKRIAPSLTLIAVTDDVDWPWDAAKPDRGPLAWVLRSDRVPGCTALPGLAMWTAQATDEWSAAHLGGDPKALVDELQSALQAQLSTPSSGSLPTRWHHVNVHRSAPRVDVRDSTGGDEVWWDESLALGVCGDFTGDGGVEAAWSSGDGLAACVAASFERTPLVACNGAALNKPTRTTSHTHLPLTGPTAVTEPAPRVLAPPIQGEAGQLAGAGLKVLHRISFSNR